MLRILLGLFFSLVLTAGYAGSAQPLSAEQAFHFSGYFSQQNKLILQWKIAPGYYLYRDRLHFSILPSSQVKLGKIILPQGQPKKDELHGSYQIYTGMLQVIVPLDAIKGKLDLGIGYQGCGFNSVCYPPIKKILDVDLAQVKPSTDVTSYLTTTNTHKKTLLHDQDFAEKLFQGHNLFFVLMSFLGLGLLLAFTPCILPMVPILSGIIVGQGKNLSTTKAFFLSLAYVLGMAITYAFAGVGVALLGGSIQALFQKTWVIVLFSGVFVLLALALFGFYELRLPSSWQQRIVAASNKQKGGTYVGVFLMGVLSTLIISPCVSAPLVGVLAYIAQTGDVVLGGSALLTMGFGMGIPLLLIGASAGKLLPKAGSWMLVIQKFFGIVLLGVAIWMIARVIPGSIALLLWATLLIGTAIFVSVSSKTISRFQKLSKGLGFLLLIYGTILFAGALSGNSDPLSPLENWKSHSTHKLSFIRIKNAEEFDRQLMLAKEKNQPVMLDFYADWCATCVTMDRHVFSNATVQKSLTHYTLLRADVTANTEFDRDIMKRFQINGPPAMIFFGDKGAELTQQRIVGEVNAKEFLDNLKK